VLSSTTVTLYTYKDYGDLGQKKKDLGFNGGTMKMLLRKAI
jgi:hypothetical protein